MLRTGILVSTMLFGVLISAAVTIQRYMSLPPGSGEDMALIGLPYNCVLYGLLPGLVIGSVVARGVGKLNVRVSRAAKRSLCGGAVVAAASLLLLLLCGRADVRKLAVTVALVVTTAQAHRCQAVWNPAQPDLLVINLGPHGHARIDYPDAGTYYYLAFCRARLRAGYSLFQAIRCTVEVQLQSQIIYQAAF